MNSIMIVGAGPTGLMLANQLTRFGVDYIIVDQKSGPTEQSRALVVQARSLEIYEQLGLSDQILADGQSGDGMNFFRNGKHAGSVKLINSDEKASPFPFLMIYEQSKNEAILYKNLLAHNREVQWNTTITHIEKEGEIYSLKATRDGVETTFQCTWLVACDGSKSVVRDFSKVPFAGGSYLNIFYVADTYTKAGFSPDRLDMFLTKTGITLLFPMKGDNHFRVLGILPKEYYHRSEIPFEEILDTARAGMKMPVEFYDTQWHSTYKLHHKKVARFSTDNIFFAGDAAHVHSPAGGQGMNTGLQDSYNLAWKLALVAKGKAGAALLETYHEERNPIANNLLKTTDRLFSGMTTDNFLFGILRLWIVPYLVPSLVKFRSVRRQLFLLVSQIKIAYTSSSLSKGKAGKIRAGMRLPYFFVTVQGRPVSVYSLVNRSPAPFTILLYNLEAGNLLLPDKELFHPIELEKNWANEKTFKSVGLPGSFIMVVRPDNYLAYISAELNLEEINRFMKNGYRLV
jgi:2-polyprenyl-6-methoxyphenol hydroxylase-like FAD-dependent oxidoreductase